MTVSIKHSTPADGSFSATGATAWNADHTLTGVGTMAEQNANNVAITGGSITGSVVSGNISGNAANVTSTVAIVNGGTGQTTQAAALTALSGTQTSGKYLRSDGTNTALATIVAADVPTLNQNTTGSAGSVANALTAGTNITFSSGTTYDGSTAITINATGGGGGMVYPGSGIPNSTGSAWGTSYSTTGSGTVVALATSPTFVTPILGTPQSGNFSTGTFTWPTFNQNTTGSAGSVANALTAGTGVTFSSGTTYDGSAAKTINAAATLAKQTDIFTSGTSATYTAPANTQWLKITVVGKGGNGGGTTSQRGSGGGAGGVAIKWLAITAGQTLTYTVNAASLPNFVTSGTYTLASDITGSGGTAGTSVAYAASFTAGGLGGAATGGDVNIRGGYGGSAFGTSTAVGTQQSGFGGSNMFGAGGYAVGMAINAGVDGLGYGAGGGGSIGSTTVGLGTNGVIIFEAY